MATVQGLVRAFALGLGSFLPVPERPALPEPEPTSEVDEDHSWMVMEGTFNTFQAPKDPADLARERDELAQWFEGKRKMNVSLAGLPCQPGTKPNG